MSVATRALLTPERLPEDNGWRTWAECRTCHAEIPIDSPDQMQDEETGEWEDVGKPNELALKLLSFGAICDECDVAQSLALGAAKRERQFAERLQISGLPRSLHGLAWGDMDRSGTRRAGIAAIGGWVEQGGHVLIYGDVGVGKTRLAATAAWDALHRRQVQWASVPVVIAWGLADDKSPERAAARRAIGGAGPLVLDDLGKEKPSDWARQQMFAAIDRRIQEGTPLIVTSNLDPDQLANRMGAWLGSRLAAFKQIQLDGNDRRL